MSEHTNNKLEKHYWVWPIACYLFLGGLGGGALFLVGILGYVNEFMIPDAFAGINAVLAPSVLAGIIALAVGTALLVFELGQPKVFLRVFLSNTAIIRYGALFLSVAMIFAIGYLVFFIPTDFLGLNGLWEFIQQFAALQTLCLIIMSMFSLLVVVYTGVLLSSLKARPFWSTPMLPVLFTVSALSTGCALITLTMGLWPSPETFDFPNLVNTKVEQVGDMPFAYISTLQLEGNTAEAIVEHMYEPILHTVDTILVAAEILVLFLFVGMTRASGQRVAKECALSWLKGKWAPFFWFGMIIIGLLIPFLIYLLHVPGLEVVAPVLVLASGLLLRFMIILTDKRTDIPGEKRFFSRLPVGDELFLQV